MFNLDRRGILFLCVANSARSQMAEGFARFFAPHDIEIFSAGSAPTHVNPYAIKVMREVGVDISGGQSKSIVDVPQDRIGLVVTLCAEEQCPTLPGHVERRHWPLPDPAAVRGSEDDILDEFRAVRDEIRERVSAMF